MKQFFNAPGFKPIFWTGLALTAAAGSFSLFFADVSLCRGEGCVQTFMEIMAPAFRVLEISMAVLVLWTIAYRSKQTNIQIEELVRANTFRDFISHRELIFGIIDEISKKENVSISKHAFYSQLFPSNSAAKFDPSLSSNFFSNCGLYNDMVSQFQCYDNRYDSSKEFETSEIHLVYQLQNLEILTEKIMHISGMVTATYLAEIKGVEVKSYNIAITPLKPIKLIYEVLSAVKNSSVGWQNGVNEPLLLPKFDIANSTEYKAIMNKIRDIR